MTYPPTPGSWGEHCKPAVLGKVGSHLRVGEDPHWRVAQAVDSHTGPEEDDHRVRIPVEFQPPDRLKVLNDRDT